MQNIDAILAIGSLTLRDNPEPHAHPRRDILECHLASANANEHDTGAITGSTPTNTSTHPGSPTQYGANFP